MTLAITLFDLCFVTPSQKTQFRRFVSLLPLLLSINYRSKHQIIVEFSFEQQELPKLFSHHVHQIYQLTQVRTSVSTFHGKIHGFNNFIWFYCSKIVRLGNFFKDADQSFKLLTTINFGFTVNNRSFIKFNDFPRSVFPVS